MPRFRRVQWLLLLGLFVSAQAAAQDAPDVETAAETASAGPAAGGDERCLRPPVELRRKHLDDRVSVSLTTCDGAPNLAVLDQVSTLARPRRLPRPTREVIERYRREHPDHRSWIAPGARRLHPGLLVRMQALADRWPGRAFIINSGFRPNARRGSRHRTGRALDFAIEGVHRREVAEFARNLAETGVGYYPNSTFTHVDVRQRTAHWADLSGPGERPRYVPWPEGDEPGVDPERARVARSEVLARVEAALDQLEASPFRPAESSDPDAPTEEPATSVPAADTARVRDEVMAEIERALRAPVQYTQTWFPEPVDWSPPFEP